MTSEVIIEAKTSNNEKNTKRLSTQVNDLQKIVYDQAEHIQRLEANLAMLAADIANTKQLMGYLHGRGNGPSVKSQ